MKTSTKSILGGRVEVIGPADCVGAVASHIETTISGPAAAVQPLKPALDDEPYVYRLKGGAIVHPFCRESYVEKRKHDAYNYPAIEAALHPGYSMPSGRFQLCDHCQTPIWEKAKGQP